jgi:hypothetical protein
MKMISRVATTAAAAASAIVLTILAAPPASAHDTPAVWYGQYGYGRITQNHHTVNACDMRSDSTGVHVNYRTADTSGTVGDTNGSKPGCGSGYSSATITQFRVCAYNVGCTTWRAP